MIKDDMTKNERWMAEEAVSQGVRARRKANELRRIEEEKSNNVSAVSDDLAARQGVGADSAQKQSQPGESLAGKIQAAYRRPSQNILY